MKSYILTIIKSMSFVLMWKLLLLTSAVIEYDKTEFSRRLIGNIYDVPDMLKAMLMCLVVITVGGLAYCYLESPESEKE